MTTTATHTDKEFDEELRILREALYAMGVRCEQQIAAAMRSLTEQDDPAAHQVIKNDEVIDQDEIEIDELAFRILATRQPVASDLRFIVMGLKFVTDLERIGDLACSIAKRGLELSRLPPLGANVDLPRLAALVHDNLRAALDSFLTRNADRATQVIRADKEIDRLNAQLFAQLLAHVATDPSTVTRVLPLTSVCRSLERIGDHVKNLAEQVVYMVKARDVRHQPTIPPGN
jgi:phosphate transport system protein